MKIKANREKKLITVKNEGNGILSVGSTREFITRLQKAIDFVEGCETERKF